MQVEELLERRAAGPLPQDRIRRHTPARLNHRIDQAMMKRVMRFAQLSREQVSNGISELDREWDLERLVETSAGALALSGLALSSLRSRKWLMLTAGTLGLLLQHSLTRRSLALAAIRSLGFRTRREIDAEKYALRMLRGDFDDLTSVGERSHRAIEALRLSRP